MSFNSTIAVIRYGYGFAPDETVPTQKAELLDQLGRGRPMAKGVAAETQTSLDFLVGYRKLKKTAKKDTSKQDAVKKMRRELIGYRYDVLRRRLSDTMTPQSGFAERLAGFWTDHFSVSAKKSLLSKVLAGSFVEEVIRPNIATSFPQMLKAVVQHPAMLEYLDQHVSVGPTSALGRNRERGLNENLARELLELHTLGVGGHYTQNDVRQLAELLTGLTFRKKGFLYNKKQAEPGTEEVLGRMYGQNGESLDNILNFLDDIARHPDTAKHIARKLVVHFVSDTPDKDHVAQVADAYYQTDGDFMSVYDALLDHPNAWIPLGQKVKRPFDYVVSGLRAFGVSSNDVASAKLRDIRKTVDVPLALMGQRFMQPLGPDGWPEDAAHWITPQGLAGRIQWANVAVQKLGAGLDPRDFVMATLQDYASDDLKLWASRAERREEGLALVLASPEFNRR